MNSWNRLLAVLDETIGFPSWIDSTVKKARQVFDEKKNEHVTNLEYPARVRLGGMGAARGKAAAQSALTVSTPT